MRRRTGSDQSKVSEAELLERLIKIFCTHGYDGASLSKISEATGLQRASLYHRFPGGKREMADAVLKHADGWFGEHGLSPLRGPGTPQQRLKRMARKLDEFYAGGERSCLLDSLSFTESEGLIRDHVKGSMEAWVGAIAALLRESGRTRKAAQESAEDAVARIQGALVMARATGNFKPFSRTMRDLPKELLKSV